MNQQIVTIDEFRNIYKFNTEKMEYIISVKSKKWAEYQINNLLENVDILEILTVDYFYNIPRLYLMIMDNIISYYFKPHLDRIYNGKRIPLLTKIEAIDFISDISDKEVKNKIGFMDIHGFYPVTFNYHKK